MTKPMLLDAFTRLPPTTRAIALDGLAGAIDLVADQAPETHRFLRYQWFAAAIAAYGGAARTILVEDDGDAVIALPYVRFGPGPAAMGAVPGSYWPFRGFPAAAQASGDAFDTLIARLGQDLNVLRIGPVYDGDAIVTRLLDAARGAGWALLDRRIATSFVLDIASQDWPRGSSLRKNRFHEKHLAAHGTLEWVYLDGADLAAGGFDDLAEIEGKSWIVDRTNGSDAKFMRTGHGAFWRMAATDPTIAAMLSAALLRIGAEPAAFSFDIDAGALKYAVANSYDPTFAKHSPGKLLHYRNLVRAKAAGVRMVDWGSGDSGYKQTLGAVEGPTIRDWLLMRPGVPAMLGRVLRGMWERSA